MKDLVQTFLQLARAGLGQTSLTEEKSLSELAVEQARQWGPHFEEKGLSFHLLGELDNNELYDSALLRTVMSNLLRNALHYTETGEVRLIVEAGAFVSKILARGFRKTTVRGSSTHLFEANRQGRRSWTWPVYSQTNLSAKGWKILVESQEK